MKQHHILKFIFTSLNPATRLLFGMLFGLSIAQLGLVILFPILTGRLVDSWISLRLHDMQGLLTRLVSAGALTIVMSLLVGYVTAFINEKVGQNIRLGSMQSLFGQELNFFRTHRQGDLMARVNQDSKMLQGYLTGVVLQGSLDIITMIVTSVILVILNPVLALMVLLLPPFNFLIVHTQAKGLESRAMMVQKTWGTFSAMLHAWLSRFREIKSTQVEEAVVHRLDEVNREVFFKSMALTKRQAILSGLATSSHFVPSVLLLTIGCYQLNAGKVTVGELFVFLQYLAFFVNPVQRLFQIKILSTTLLAPFQRLQEIIRSSPPVEVGTASERFVITKITNLSFENACVRPSVAGSMSLEWDNLHLGNGRMVGIKGNNGSGKSTLLMAISGLVPLEHGTVFVNGVPVNDAIYQTWRNHVLFIPQNALIYPSSLVDNICLFQSPDEKKLELCLKRVGLWDWVQNFPKRWHHEPESADNSLSGGEIQRLLLARMVYHPNRTIRVLDEPENNLDGMGKTILLDLLRERKDKCITVVASHDEDILGQCDLVFQLVLNYGVGRLEPIQTEVFT